jgi:hypothetical protein
MTGVLFMQVKIDWEAINAKVEAEYRQERERPSQNTATVR